MPRISPLITLTALLQISAVAQHPANSDVLDQGQRAFAKHCAACHGGDAEGTDMGPSLAGTRRMRSRSAAQVRNIINRGMPSAGMPAFDLPAPELDALAAFVRSLNIP